MSADERGESEQGRGAWIGRRPGVAGRGLATCFKGVALRRLCPCKPGEAEQEHEAQGDGGANRAVEITAPTAHGLARGTTTNSRNPEAGHGAELTAGTVEGQAAHLAMGNSARQYIEQDAGIEHPGNQRAVFAGSVHGGDFSTWY